MTRSAFSLARGVRIRRRRACYELDEVVDVTDIACEKCGGALFVDREAVLQVARRGFRGGRVFCVAGCTDVWLIEPARTMTERAVKPPDGRGKYLRRVRTVSCRVCERHYQTRGTKPGRCKACRAEAQRRRLPLLNPPGNVRGNFHCARHESAEPSRLSTQQLADR